MVPVTIKAIALAALLVSTSAVTQAAEPAVTLHCSGKTWHAVGVTGELPTDALLRIDDNGTYIAITAVGTGQSDKPPRPATNVESVGSIQLRSTAEGQPPADAWFNINRYTGELVVAPTGSGGKGFFVGSCKKADPLF